MINYVTYNVPTGKIITAGSVSLVEDLAIQSGGNTVLTTTDRVNPFTQYIYSGVVTTRPDFNLVITIVNAGGWLADNTDYYRINGLPNPTVITVRCDDRLLVSPGGITVTDGFWQMKTPIAGTYTISLISFPYLDKEIIVSAT